ncbi:hypothetical protein HMPREF9336_02807 [Segniliparus rugosus ATCC BAA-974]|uniref:AB hydrolase-1 domain-containing protein n=1 Tax=Segniliparus rugosus (strain ATCC BAA-974 / DSM 45345 / CCUG 50838 / CIP 108380 / JCM 13579 / CDC 945) TaxID=679197 RepID=E5XTI5_SEGRC|nr:alpha/beta fold hydrolase [Segniliparus rugosus]EFV12345.1 hypothetical protein HMPREF9336_02807 [Segniliparus rugosus ATCC BAA-974]
MLDEGPLDGPVVVLLHGFPERSGSWRGVIPPLVAAGRRVLAPDQRGYSPGARPEGAKHYTLDLLVGDVLALADQPGAEVFDLVVHDWGAAVAWALVSEHAAKVRTVTCLSVPHPRTMAAALLRGQLFKSWYAVLFQLPRLPERLVRVRDGWVFRRVMPPVFGMSDSLVQEALTLLREPGAATATINWYRAVRHSSHLEIPGRVSRPTLYVRSDRDAALSRAAAVRTGQWVDCPYRFEILEGVSHWIPEERPKETAALVLEHLASVPVSAQTTP